MLFVLFLFSYRIIHQMGFMLNFVKSFKLILPAKLQCCEDGRGNTYILVKTFIVRM